MKSLSIFKCTETQEFMNLIEVQKLFLNLQSCAKLSEPTIVSSTQQSLCSNFQVQKFYNFKDIKTKPWQHEMKPGMWVLEGFAA